MKKILIVDDSSSNVLLLQNFLEEEGFVTEVAFSGKEALKITKQFTPDLILLDLMMPDLSGIEVIKRLEIQVPIIMVSANRDSKLIEEAKKLGVKSYVQKPIDFDEILQEITRNISAK
ncbi:MAG: response regulator [Bacteroidales bacterium]|jgi:DNA-binding response OmpR family regulator|nr:response regulator [Bacteroidales bacterium]